jgi:hypothetical protein
LVNDDQSCFYGFCIHLSKAVEAIIMKHKFSLTLSTLEGLEIAHNYRTILGFRGGHWLRIRINNPIEGVLK